MNKIQKPKNKITIIILIIITSFCIGFLILDSIISYLVEYTNEASFLDHLFLDITDHEFTMRFLVILSFFIGGFFAIIFSRKHIESEEKLRSFMNSAPDAFVLFDSDLNYTAINEVGLRMGGLKIKKRDIIGHNITEFIPDIKELGRYDQYKEVIRTGKPLFIEDLVTHPKFGNLYMTIRAFKVSGGMGYIETDVTKLRRIEDQLKKTIDELEYNNAELEKFAYVASHDLQEPLRLISSFIQLLAKRYKDKLDSDANEYIKFAVEGTIRMRRLINDLLSYSRVTRIKEFKSSNVSVILSQSINNLQMIIESNKAKITNEPLPEEIFCDPLQMVQVFQNLISNAIKFRKKEPPRIHISAFLSKTKNEWKFLVKDNGIGIERQYFERIFIIFQRLHAKKEYPGTGIGLAICKRIIEHHGGKIWVLSKRGKGSTFYFTIPNNQKRC